MQRPVLHSKLYRKQVRPRIRFRALVSCILRNHLCTSLGKCGQTGFSPRILVLSAFARGIPGAARGDLHAG